MAIQFCHRFGNGLRAGAPMLRLLEAESGIGPPRHRRAITRLARGVKDGELVSELMSQDPYFPPLMTAMVRVGDETGRLEHTLLTLSERYREKQNTRRAFVSSIAWPVLQLILGIGVISLLILVLGIFSPPTGGEMVDILGFGLRGPSGVLWFWFYLSLVFGFIGLLFWGFARNVGGVQNLVPFIYMVPGIGSSIQTITISRFCWTLALALGSGIDPIRSIRLALDSTDSDYYRSAAPHSQRAVEDGASLAGAIEATALFPIDFVQRIEIAEQSGTDAESMEFLTEEYSERAKRAVKVISGVATGVIWLGIMALFIFLIFRIAGIIFGFYDVVNEPIIPRR